MNYSDIIEASVASQVSYEAANPSGGFPSLKMVGTPFPWSIKESEFMALRRTVGENGLLRGYEVATAFGISALASGLGFKSTGGKLVTMDAYIEENSESSASYMNGEARKYGESKGYQSIKALIDIHGLQETLYPEVGWSPTDTAGVLGKHFDLGTEKLDFVLIDAGHWDSALLQDVHSVLPYLDKERFVLFIHDTHCFSPACLSTVSELLGGELVWLPSCAMPMGYNMSCISRGITVHG